MTRPDTPIESAQTTPVGDWIKNSLGANEESEVLESHPSSAPRESINEL